MELINLEKKVMSLDIWVYRKGTTHWEDGSIEEIKDFVFDRNITHNVNKMAMNAGFYDAMWRPDENGYKQCKDVLQILEKGLKYMSDNPNELRRLEPTNGWGSYEGLCELLTQYIECCKKYPNAYIEVDR